MEIITEKHKAPDEIVPAGTSDKDVQQEVNRRTYKAGYTDRDGQPRRTSTGKGDNFRPCNRKKYAENYEKIFKHK